MTNFTDGAPTTPSEYLDLGCDITPCIGKRPILANWQNNKTKDIDWTRKRNEPKPNIGLKMTGLRDIDCDNHFVKRFAGKYLLTPASTYGRKSNPNSHYIFSGETDYKIYTMPKDFDDYCKSFPHGNTLLEVRSGNTKQSIAPGSAIDGENVDWQHWVGFQKYVGNFKKDVGKIALSTALAILYPAKGARDNYCYAIAGVLKNHTEWTANEIDIFVYNLAVFSGKEDEQSQNERISMGTKAYNDNTKNLGLPKLSEILKCSVSGVAKLFEWVGVKDCASQFTDLRVYHTEPKYWVFKFNGHDITIMDTSLLLSYTKIKILILENTLQEPPELKPAEWKSIRMDLLRNVKEIEAPDESSYYGMIGMELVEWANYNRHQSDDDLDRLTDSSPMMGILRSKKHNGYLFKLSGLIGRIKRKGLAFENRRLTHYLRTKFDGEDIRIFIGDKQTGTKKKQFRVWRIPYSKIEESNVDMELGLNMRQEKRKKEEEKTGHSYLKPEVPY
jgi:hypothetical protein